MVHYQRLFHITRRTLKLPLTLPLPLLEADQVMDSCNKTVAVFHIGQQSKFTTCVSPYTQDLMHRLWFHPLKTDVEFGRFLAKFYRIEGPPSKPTTYQVLQVHKALCQQVDRFLGGTDHMHPKSVYGDVLYNPKQKEHFRLLPPFRSLVMVIDDSAFSHDNPHVRLVRSHCGDGLSQAITFSSIKGKAQGKSERSEEVMTDLMTATKFIIDLERQEAAAYPEYYKDPDSLDEHYGDPNVQVSLWNYKGGQIRGPSTSWVEGEPEAQPVPMRCKEVRFSNIERY